MNDRKIRVAITHGDTNGIGYELIFKTFASPEMLDLCTPIIYGSPKIAAYHRNALNIQANFSIVNDVDEIQDGRVNLLTCFDDEVKVELGISTEESARSAVRALDRAMTDFRHGVYDVLVSAPLIPNNLKVGGLEFKSVAHYLQICLGDGHETLSLFMNDFVRIAMVSNSLNIKDVPADITEHNIVEKAAIIYKTLKQDFCISNPRIAILALNANIHGTEEQEVIEPTVAKLADAGMCAFGPYLSEDFFGSNQYQAFDAVLAMYPEQALLPFKTLSVNAGVRLIANIPLVCTTTNVGPQFDMAGKGIANEETLRQAIFLATDIWRHRKTYEEALKNSLPKLYHEHKDDKGKYNAVKRNEQQGEENNQKQQKAE